MSTTQSNIKTFEQLKSELAAAGKEYISVYNVCEYESDIDPDFIIRSEAMVEELKTKYLKAEYLEPLFAIETEEEEFIKQNPDINKFGDKYEDKMKEFIARKNEILVNFRQIFPSYSYLEPKHLTDGHCLNFILRQFLFLTPAEKEQKTNMESAMQQIVVELNAHPQRYFDVVTGFKCESQVNGGRYSLTFLSGVAKLYIIWPNPEDDIRDSCQPKRNIYYLDSVIFYDTINY